MTECSFAVVICLVFLHLQEMRNSFVLRSGATPVQPRQSVTEDDDRINSYIQKQKTQLAQMKEQFAHLRTQYNDFKRDYQIQSLQLQRQIGAIQKRRHASEQRLADMKNNMTSSANEQVAGEIIERIWDLLTKFRKEVFAKAGVPMPEPDELTKPSPETSPCILLDESVETPVITPNPIPSVRDTPIEYESIASRRTRRSTVTDVYYKEPSLRSTLTPGDPYTFSLGEKIITPTIPDGYTRDTPSISHRRSRKNK